MAQCLSGSLHSINSIHCYEMKRYRRVCVCIMCACMCVRANVYWGWSSSACWFGFFFLSFPVLAHVVCRHVWMYARVCMGVCVCVRSYVYGCMCVHRSGSSKFQGLQMTWEFTDSGYSKLTSLPQGTLLPHSTPPPQLPLEH